MRALEIIDARIKDLEQERAMIAASQFPQVTKDYKRERIGIIVAELHAMRSTMGRIDHEANSQEVVLDKFEHNGHHMMITKLNGLLGYIDGKLEYCPMGVAQDALKQAMMCRKED